MDINNLTGVYNQNPTLQGQYTLQQYLDLFGQGATPPTTGTPPPVQITPSDPNAPKAGIINSNINQYQSGGSDKYQGGGAFGNLDINDVKTFQKDVYNSKTGKFEQQTVTGYMNPGIGYQTFDGKNINNAGMGFKGIAGMALDAMGLGTEVDENGYYDGQISGTFTGFKPGDFKNIQSFYKTKKDRQKFMDNNKIEIDRVKKKKLMEDIRKMEADKQQAKNARDLITIQQRAARGDSMGDIGRDMYSGPGMAFEARTDTFTGGKKTDTSPGAYNSPRKDGGLMGKGGSRVKSYFKGGIVSLRGR